MGYVKITTLAVLVVAAALPLWKQNRQWQTLVYTLSVTHAGDVEQPSRAEALHLRSDGDHITGMEVLYVLDPNFYLCWESVPVDELSKASLLPWLLELQDLATQTQSHPAGELLEVRSCAQ